MSICGGRVNRSIPPPHAISPAQTEFTTTVTLIESPPVNLPFGDDRRDHRLRVDRAEESKLAGERRRRTDPSNHFAAQGQYAAAKADRRGVRRHSAVKTDLAVPGQDV